MIHNYKKLKVWQKAIELVTSIYNATQAFPKEEIYCLVSQIRRSAVSIPSNIAEGAGRNTDKEFSRYLSIAIGSAYEIETQLIVSNNLEYINSDQYNVILTKITEVQKMLYRLIESLKK